MKTATLKLETLHLIPLLAEEFEAQVSALVADCHRRPGLNKKRTLKIELEITPTTDDAEDVFIQPVISSKRPSMAIDKVRGRRTRQGQLQFDFSEESDGE